jgi:hypothetical protein
MKARMRWAEHIARMGEKRNSYRLLVGKPEGRRPLETRRRRWLDNIRMDILELGWGEMDCACSKDGAAVERVKVVGGKARGKEATRKTKT